MLLDAKHIFGWIRENIGKYAYVSIMCQYTPMYNAFSYEEINRKITASEYEEALDCFFAAGLENGFMQEPESADSGYTPIFDMLGI